MHSISRALLPLWMLALHCAAGAGPMVASEADAAPAATARLGLSAPGLGEGMAAEPPPSAASGSALAVEIITEAEAGTVTPEVPRGPRREGARAANASAPPGPAARKPERTSDDPWGVREVGKAALQWMKDAVPWLRSEGARDAGGGGVTPDAANWSDSPLEAAQAARGATHASNAPPGAGAEGTVSMVIYGDAAQPQFVDPEQTLVRVAFNTVRKVLGHPMTWLVVLLFVVAGIVVKKIDRRPTD